MTFDNGCKIVAEATSANSGRGSSINCIAGSERIDLIVDRKPYAFTFENAYRVLSELEKGIRTPEAPICRHCHEHECRFDEELGEYLSTCSDECEKKFLEETHADAESTISSLKILTDNGWSSFLSIVKYDKKKTFLYDINGTSLRCTPDHKIWDGNGFREASSFPCLGHGKKEHVYDILNVEKENRFLIDNKILVHNCLILDEFAFINARYRGRVSPVSLPCCL